MREEMRSKTKNYKINVTLYTILSVISFAIIGLSFLTTEGNERCFTVIAGLGCSGIASIVVAWLIDYANCIQKEKANSDLLEHMFAGFDAEVKNALSLLLETYSTRNKDVDIDKKYTIVELSNLINDADENLKIWDRYYRMLGDAFSAIDPTALFYDPIQQHVELFSTIRIAQSNYKSYKNMVERLDEESICSLSHFFLCDAINHCKEIDELRDKKTICAIRENLKGHIISFRNKVKENQKKQKKILTEIKLKKNEQKITEMKL